MFCNTTIPKRKKKNNNQESKASIARIILTLAQRLSEQAEYEHDSILSNSGYSAFESLSIYDETKENEVKSMGENKAKQKPSFETKLAASSQ